MLPASRAHLSSTSLTKLRSLDTAAMPITARCQMSFSATSAAATLKRERRRSTTLRTTCRLSFSEEAPWTWSVSLRIPTTICTSRGPRRLGQRGPDRLQLVRLDHVAGLEIGEVLDPDSALESLVHLSDVVLEALEGSDLAGDDGLLVAQQAHHRGPGDLAVGDRGAGDSPQLRHVEGLQHLRVAHHLLLDDGLEQALHGQLHVVERLVDDVVLLERHSLRRGRLRRLRLGFDAEPHDHGLRGSGQHHVALGDVADGRMNHVHGDLRSGQLRQRRLQRFDRPMDVGLDDDLEDLGLVLLAFGEDVLDGELVALREILLALLLQAVLADTGIIIASPPHSSEMSPSSESCCLMRSGCASGLSILLIATTTVTSAALAWLIDSTVCGITPSSAATTSTAMSVTLAPRARMAVKASWPGVSRKVIDASPPSEPTTSTE